MWINPEITCVGLWMIFCTWISSGINTGVDLKLLKLKYITLENHAHVRGINKGKEGLQTFRCCSRVRDDFCIVTYCGLLWLSCLCACETRQNHSTKAFQARVTSFVCTERGGRMYLKGTLEGTRWCCDWFIVVTTKVITDSWHRFYAYRSDDFFLSPHSNAQCQSQFKQKWKNKKKERHEFRIDKPQSLFTSSEVFWRFWWVWNTFFTAPCVWC